MTRVRNLILGSLATATVVTVGMSADPASAEAAPPEPPVVAQSQDVSEPPATTDPTSTTPPATVASPPDEGSVPATEDPAGAPSATVPTTTVNAPPSTTSAPTDVTTPDRTDPIEPPATTEAKVIPDQVADRVPSPLAEAPAAPIVDEDGNTVLGSSPPLSRAAAGDRFIVQVEDRAALTDVVSDATADGVAIDNTLRGAVTGFTAPLDAASVAQLRGRDDVVAVERDKQIEFSGVQNGPTWGLDRIDQRALPLNSKYSYRDTGAGVRAYVIDSGIRPNHVDFAGRIDRGAYIDFGDGMGIVDCNGHGTHVSGTLGGSTWGVAKEVTIVPVKVGSCAGGLLYSDIVAGVNWVIGNHRAGQPAVANMSLGGPASTVMDNSVRALVQDGVTVVVAAGNETQPTCNVSPARVSQAITVAASTRSDDDAYFSNYGACNDLFAPGVGIRSASYTSNTGSLLLDGTSMASPHVAGAAALVLQRNQSATPAQVWAAIDADTTKGALSQCCGDPDKLLHIRPAAARTPSAPRALSAARGSNTAKLSWRAPASNGGAAITDYVVQRSANGGRTWRTVRDGVSIARTATVRGLTTGHRYTFRVAAKNRVGRGPWSPSAATTPR